MVPNSGAEKNAIGQALGRKIRALQGEFAGVGSTDLGKEFRIDIPDKYRVGHEPHFAQVTQKFLGFLKQPGSVPAWEKPNMLAKYWVTTQALKLSRQ